MPKRERLRPEGAPPIGETYRSWRDFTDRVARPWVENDGDDPRVDTWYRVLMIEATPWYLACALVIADNRIRGLEGVRWYHLDGTLCVAGWDPSTGLCGEGGGPVTPCPDIGSRSDV